MEVLEASLDFSQETLRLLNIILNTFIQTRNKKIILISYDIRIEWLNIAIKMWIHQIHSLNKLKLVQKNSRQVTLRLLSDMICNSNASYY